MKRTLMILMLMPVLLPFLAGGTSAQEVKKDGPPRLKRSESFLGIHFDFHAGDDCTEIGKNVDREMVEYIIDMVKPDYVQIDCKGHRGLTSYPTKAGNPAPGFVRDPLKIWREVTAERGVALYMHYSGVWDTEAVTQHPEWARVDEKGEPDKRLTSVFGPYVDELLIPQLKELSDVYGVDGVWVDGECWAVDRDYSDKAIAAFRTETGIQDIPRSPEDPHWYEWNQFHREAFRSYVRHYVDELHRHNPNFQLCSNWGFSSEMPEPVSVNLDYISGDYSPLNSINAARFEGRCMMHQGKPWDLMAWHFTWTDGPYSTKTVPQLQQEAAAVLALGGGFQAYFPQKRDGSIRKWQMGLMAETATFCRARQELCHKAEPVPQIGLVYAGKAYFRSSNKLFGGWDNPPLLGLKGTLQALLDAQNVVEIVMEHHLECRMDEYPLLVYPEWDYIDPAFRNDLLRYVRNGGNLIVIGPKAAKLFADVLDVTLAGEPVERVSALEHKGWLGGVRGLWQKGRPGSTAQPFGRIYLNNDFEGEPDVAATITPLGRGKIAAVYLNLGEYYLGRGTTVTRDFLDSLVDELFPAKTVEVTGSHYVDVTLMRKNGKLMVNLVNTTGEHANDRVLVYDDIPPVGPLTVSVRLDRRPGKVTLQPSNEPLAFQYVNGRMLCSIDRLKIHEVVVIE